MKLARARNLKASFLSQPLEQFAYEWRGRVEGRRWLAATDDGAPGLVLAPPGDLTTAWIERELDDGLMAIESSSRPGTWLCGQSGRVRLVPEPEARSLTGARWRVHPRSDGLVGLECMTGEPAQAPRRHRRHRIRINGPVAVTQSTREGKWPKAWLGSYAGDLQSDAYAGYDALGETGEVRLVGCWAHARRKFYDHRTLAPAFCRQVLDDIGELCAIEKEIRGEPPDERRAARRARARLRVRNGASPTNGQSQIRTWLDEQDALPKSAAGQAIEYVRSRWDAFTRYTTSGILSIDNNLAENALRCVALGRKNWLFAGSDKGGRCSP